MISGNGVVPSRPSRVHNKIKYATPQGVLPSEYMNHDYRFYESQFGRGFTRRGLLRRFITVVTFITHGCALYMRGRGVINHVVRCALQVLVCCVNPSVL